MKIGRDLRARHPSRRMTLDHLAANSFARLRDERERVNSVKSLKGLTGIFCSATNA